ncbi:reverse transcriptase domain-containing protein [Tanacetum coccineum]
MADDQPMWGNNRAVAPTPEVAIVAVDLGDNFTVKGYHISMIKDQQFDGRSRVEPHKHIAEFIKVCGMFCYGNTNADAIKLKLFPSSLSREAKIWFNELSLGVITTWKEMRQALISQFFPPAINWRDRQSRYRDENRSSNPNEENSPIPRLPEKKPDESEFEKTMREFVVAQKAKNDFVKNQFYNLKTKVEQGQKNHQAAIQDLEMKFGRISDHQSSRPTVARLMIHAKPAVFLDDSEEEAEEVEKEAEPLPKKPTQADPSPLKAYKPKIPYPQCLHKEKMEARYAKFLDMIKEVRINVPLVDVLAGMPNYGKFLKDLVSNKSKMEQISAAFLTKECSAILQNKLPPKLGDPKSFLIPCKFINSVEYLALADLGASINLMPYSLYAALFGITLKPTRMSIRLANHTYQYHMGVAKNMLVQVGKFVFLVDFVILQIEEDDRAPLILRSPFLHTTDAIIRVKNKELNLGIREDRATFLIDKAMQYSYLNDDTCFHMDVIDEVTEDELDALLDDSKPFLSTSERISETSLDKEFKDNFEELPPKDELRIKTSIQDPPTDLEMKPLPKHLEYTFLEEKSLLPVVISALLEQNEKERLISVLKIIRKLSLGKHPIFQGLALSFSNTKSTLRTMLNQSFKDNVDLTLR